MFLFSMYFLFVEHRLGTIYAMAGMLQETYFLWMVRLNLAHQSVHLCNEGKK